MPRNNKLHFANKTIKGLLNGRLDSILSRMYPEGNWDSFMCALKWGVLTFFKHKLEWLHYSNIIDMRNQ
jgi:hypothetical protein